MSSAVADSVEREVTSTQPLNRVEVRLPDDPFLLSKFEEFYGNVMQFKSQLAAGTPLSAPDTQKLLVDLFAQQREEVSRTGTLLGLEMYRQAQRVMACLADSIFAAYSWPGGREWPSLEGRLFNVAKPTGFSPGGQCFRKLDELSRQYDPVYRELASVYFYALALGNFDIAGRAKYLALLREIISAPEKSPHLFAQSYAHTLAESKVTFLPSPKKWVWALASILAAWFALSWILWLQVSTDVENEVHAIERALQ
jgi:hypothetical protein